MGGEELPVLGDDRAGRVHFPGGDERADERVQRPHGAHRLPDGDREPEPFRAPRHGLGEPACRDRDLGADGGVPRPQLRVPEAGEGGQGGVTAAVAPARSARVVRQ